MTTIYVKDENTGEVKQLSGLSVGNMSIESPVDDLLSFVEVIGAFHAKIHSGDTFSVEYLTTHDSGDIADDDSIEIAFSVGNNVYPHFKAEATVGGDAELSFYEGAEIGEDGTDLDVFNRNRNSSNTCGVTVTANPTISNVGSAIDTFFIPGGDHQFSIGTGEGNDQEWILKPNTIYVIKITNRSGSALQMGLRADWYE